jgi:superfamily II DNA or RNA helicase
VNLLDWQVPLAAEQTDKFARHNVVLSAFPTGVGKTYITSAMLAQLKKPALIVCPKTIITAWHRTLEGFGVDNVVDVLNWEKLHKARRPHLHDGKLWKLPEGTIVVVDEVHKGCSGPTTDSGKMLAVAKAQKYPIVLQSATVADSPLKMRSVGFVLGLHNYRADDFYGWCRRNGCFEPPYRPGLDFPKGPRGRQLMAAIHKQIADKMVFRDVESIPGFPECLVTAELFDLDQREKAEIDKLYEEMGAELKKPSATELVATLRARQQVEWLKTPILCEETQEELAEGRSVVVFVSFRDTLARVERDLRAVGVSNVSVVHGDQTSTERQANVDAFQTNQNHVILCMIQAGGVAISLHDERKARPRVSLVTPSFNATEVVQALGRIRRTGGTKAIQRFILVAGTVEERVHKAIQRKLGNIEALNDGDLTPV